MKKKNSKSHKKKNVLKFSVQGLMLIALVFALYSVMNGRAKQIQRNEDLRKEQEAQLSSVPSPTAHPIEVTPSPEPSPEPEYFILSCIGDMTLITYNWEQTQYGFTARMNGDYSYPFKNTVSYFENDEFTLGNLECTFSEEKLQASYTQMYAFCCPAEWINILPLGGVDFVTTANNHAMDFFERGVEDTRAILDSIGFKYGIEDQAQIVETPNGIRLGIYTAGNNAGTEVVPNKDKALAGVEQLKDMGADYIICMFHWGLEINYDPQQKQIDLAYALVDAGADLIYGSHSHCLQPVEEYKGALILYSLGNWCFGGNTAPTDPDTAIIQITLKRDIDGTITNDGITAIPCCVSSNIEGAAIKQDHYNDFCPTPYEEGSSQYEMVMKKLSGTSGLGNPGRDYSDVWASRGA